MKTLKKILALGSLLTIFALVIFVSVSPSITKGATTVFTGGQTYYLAGSGITSISATSIALTSFTIPQTGHELTTADVAGVGGKFYITLEPGKTSKQEFISCTTVTQGSGTSAVISGCSRGLLPFSPYTASSAYAFTHVGGAPLIISNSPAFYDLFALKGNNETITGNWDYTANVTLDVDCTIGSANDEVCAKGYIDAQITSGAPNANPTTKGIVQIATGLQIASSTQLGSTGAYNVISANNATSTYGNGSTSGLKAVITQNDGHIDSNFIRQSDTLTWTNNQNFNATTTIAAGTTTPLKLNGITYSFPSTGLASSTVWGFSSTGTASFMPIYPLAVAGATRLIAKSEAEVTSASLTYVDSGKSITFSKSGVFTISFELKAQSTYTAYGKLYLNGSLVGTEQTTTSTSYDPKAQNISANIGDVLTVQIHNSSAGYTMYLDKLRIYEGGWTGSDSM